MKSSGKHKAFLVAMAVSMVFTGRAQDRVSTFYLSFFAGGSIFGAETDIESNMLASGFGSSGGGWFGSSGSNSYNKAPSLAAEGTYFFSEKGGISLVGGISDNIEPSGYNGVGYGFYLTFKSELWSLALAYTYRSKNQRHFLSAGPSFYNHRVKGTSASFDFPNESFKKPGLYLSYSYLLVNRKSWLMALKTNIRLVPGSKIGPYEDTQTVGIGTDNPETFTSVFEETKVNLNVIELGLAIGLKAGK